MESPTTPGLNEPMTELEAFKKVYDILDVIHKKGLIYCDSLEWRPEENKFTLWGSVIPAGFNKELSEPAHFKVPFFEPSKLTTMPAFTIDERASQCLIFMKLEILTYIVTSKTFLEYEPKN